MKRTFCEALESRRLFSTTLGVLTYDVDAAGQLTVNEPVGSTSNAPVAELTDFRDAQGNVIGVVLSDAKGTTPAFLAGVTSVLVKIADGVGVAEVIDLCAVPVTVDQGNGKQTLLAANAGLGQLTINEGDGKDSVTAFNASSDPANLVVNTGNGNDSVTTIGMVTVNP